MRLAGLCVAGFAAVGAVGLLAAGAIAPALWVVFEAGILAAGFVFERTTYKAIEKRPSADWSPTEERFVDPTSGRMVRVYARGGERKYVADEDDPGRRQDAAGS